ncbi:phosphoenolpyruvate carboxykinase (ATP), partial [Candidatus Micrarchaeota archaeon]|nr:phosphoenolpyruvate carboxykinase (ATP) [Candidatus Micrarchaeota archaeon]
KKDKYWNYLVPEGITGFDFSEFGSEKYYSKEEFEEKTEALRKERIEWLKQFPELKKEILEAVQAKE